MMAGFGLVRWRIVLPFLALVFALTWFVIFLEGWLSGTTGVEPQGLAPVGMFMPATVALFLRMYVVRDSRLYHRTYREAPRWIARGFFFLVVLEAGIVGLAFTRLFPPAVLRASSGWALILWTLLIIRVHRKHGEESFRRGGLQLGNTNLGAVFVVAFVLFLAAQSALNLLFGLSDWNPPAERILGFPIPGGLYPFALVPLFLLSAVGTPLGGLAVVFGEEYAWRGFLQDELAPLGRLPASLLIGWIWGAWHIPIILSGVHTYPPTLAGIGLGFVFFLLWGVVQSYAVFKTGSVWAAVFLHGVVNGVYAFLRTYVERPEDKVFSFGLGVYGLLCLAFVVAGVLRDPLWRSQIETEHLGRGFLMVGESPGELR